MDAALFLTWLPIYTSHLGLHTKKSKAKQKGPPKPATKQDQKGLGGYLFLATLASKSLVSYLESTHPTSRKLDSLFLYLAYKLLAVSFVIDLLTLVNPLMVNVNWFRESVDRGLVLFLACVTHNPSNPSSLGELAFHTVVVLAKWAFETGR